MINLYFPLRGFPSSVTSTILFCCGKALVQEQHAPANESYINLIKFIHQNMTYFYVSSYLRVENGVDVSIFLMSTLSDSQPLKILVDSCKTTYLQ